MVQPRDWSWSHTEPRADWLAGVWEYAIGRPAIEHEEYANAVQIAERDNWDPWWIRTWQDVVAVVRHGCFFDQDATRPVLMFFPHIKHSKGVHAGQPFLLEDWQQWDITMPLFGWKRPDGTRRYRQAYIEIPKKNGKTTLCAGYGLVFLTADGESTPEVYTCAGDRNQAAFIHDESARMARSWPHMLDRLDIVDSRKTIAFPSANGKYTALSADAHLQEGLNWHAVLFDELHVQPNRVLWDTIEQGGIARKQPVLIAITTAGVYDRTSLGFEQHDYARRVNEGIVDDLSMLTYMAYSEKDADWTDPAVWKRANPNWGVTIQEDTFRDFVRKAIASPAKQNAFRRYRLDQWVQQSDRWLDMRLWQACSGPVDAKSLKGRPCFGGLDLSSVKDLTSFALVFPPMEPDEPIKVLSYNFVPSENVQDRVMSDGAPYGDWIRDGVLETTDGRTVDYDYIKAKVRWVAEMFDLRELAYDPMYATQISIQLSDEGYTMVEFRQTLTHYTPAMTELDRMVREGQLAHGGHPVLGWAADNLAVRVGAKGEMKPDKSSCKEKIDPIVAMLMGIARMVANPEVGGYQPIFML